MGRSTSIADVGMSIVKLLRRELVPDTLQNPDAVGLCSPTDRGDYMVGIHLYDIRESEELRVNTMIARGTEELQYPPSYVNLYYMITVTSTGDIKFRSGEEHKILGRIIQILADHPCLDRDPGAKNSEKTAGCGDQYAESDAGRQDENLQRTKCRL